MLTPEKIELIARECKRANSWYGSYMYHEAAERGYDFDEAQRCKEMHQKCIENIASLASGGEVLHDTCD